MKKMEEVKEEITSICQFEQLMARESQGSQRETIKRENRAKAAKMAHFVRLLERRWYLDSMLAMDEISLAMASFWPWKRWGNRSPGRRRA
jgi:hypothetical protein